LDVVSQLDSAQFERQLCRSKISLVGWKFIIVTYGKSNFTWRYKAASSRILRIKSCRSTSMILRIKSCQIIPVELAVDLSLLANHRHQTAPDTVQLGKALHVGDEVCGQILRAPQRRVFLLRLGKVLTAVVPAVCWSSTSFTCRFWVQSVYGLMRFTKSVVTFLKKLLDFVLFANSSIVNFNAFAQKAFRGKNII